MATLDTLEIVVRVKDLATEAMRKITAGTGVTVKKAVTHFAELRKTLDVNRIAFGALGIASAHFLMSLASNSALASAMGTEFSLVLGYIGDTIMTVLMPVLEPLLDLLWEFADWFAGAPPLVQYIISGLTLLGGAMVTILPIIGMVGPAFKAGWKIAADAVSDVYDVVQKKLVPALKAAWTTITDVATKAWSAISKAASAAWDSIKVWGAAAADAIKAAWETVRSVFADTIVPALKAAWTSLKDHVVSIGTAISDAISGVSSWFTKTVVPAFGSAISQLGQWVTNHSSMWMALGLSIAAGAAALMAWNARSKEEKAMWSALTGILMGLAAAQWAVNIAKAVGITLSTFGVGAIVVGVAAASAAAMYLLSSQYGAKAEAPPAMAEGGIVTAPTLALIGERGPEAVIPLNKGGLGGNVTVNFDLSGAVIGDPNRLAGVLRQAGGDIADQLSRRGVTARRI